jgi:hypothetical protein
VFSVGILNLPEERPGSGGGDEETPPLATDLTPARLHPLVRQCCSVIRSRARRGLLDHSEPLKSVRKPVIHGAMCAV